MDTHINRVCKALCMVVVVVAALGVYESFFLLVALLDYCMCVSVCVSARAGGRVTG